MSDLYRKPEILMLAGITDRQYNWWIGRGYLGRERRWEKPGSGVPRLWTQAELERFIEIREAFEKAGQILEKAGLYYDGDGFEGMGALTRDRRGATA